MGSGDVLVHIGLPKTGTTYLQSCLAGHVDDLAALGVDYPGDDTNQVPALFAPLEWFSPARDHHHAGERWQRLRQQVASHRDRVVISAENLAVADAEKAARVIGGLGYERCRVVVTLRALDLVLSSFWQHEVRAGLTTGFDDWAEEMALGPGGTNENSSFWIVNDWGRVIDVWTSVCGAERVAVVVLPRHAGESILRSFEHLIGLPDSLLSPTHAARTNRSMTWAEAELIRQLNVSLAGRVSPRIFSETVPDGAIVQMLESYQPELGERRIEVNRSVSDRLVEPTRLGIERIRHSGVAVVGDLEHLQIPTEPTKSHETDAVDSPDATHIPMGSAAPLIEHLVLVIERLRKRSAKAG